MQARPPCPRRRPAAIPLALAAVALAAALAGCGPKPDSEAQAASTTPRNVTLTAAQLQHIHLYTVTSSSFSRAIEATGTVDFDNDQATSVLAPFSGPVSRLLVSPGQQVRQGQPLALVDSPDFAAAIGAYSKALATARNARRLADADKDLAQHNGISQREAQQAETDAANADADRDAAQQALVSLNLDPGTIRAIQQGRSLSRAPGVIRSPISGTVVEKLITPGQLLQAGSTPSFTVANLSKVWVMAQVSPADLAAVHVGDVAEVETGAGSSPLFGRVDNISALVNPDTRSVIVRVVVDNPGVLLKKQMYVRVRIRSRQASTGLLAPVSAILRDDDNLPFVYVADSAGGFARRHVTLGARTGDQYDIAEGLRPGDRIVVDGAIFVQFMQTQ
jgi:cobalt-zinc-cadmium efflux system membrane fusion protein